MCEDVDLDSSHRSSISQQDDVQPLKRVQIKLETGTGESDSEDQDVDIQQQEEDDSNVTHFIPMQEEVIIHQEAMEMHEGDDDEQSPNQAVSIVSEDPLTQAVKVTQRTGDVGAENVASLITSSAMLDLAASQHDATAMLDITATQLTASAMLDIRTAQHAATSQAAIVRVKQPLLVVYLPSL